MVINFNPQLFLTESPGPTTDNLAPQVRKTAALLWRFYVGLTATEFIALTLAGMPAYDALCHSMTTLSAGGFSPHAQSIMGYGNPVVEWIICIFMFLAGANFVLQYRAIFGGALGRVRLRYDDEFRMYVGIAMIATTLLALLLLTVEGNTRPLRQAVFQTLSILTTTGYASTDFGLWSDQLQVVLLALMFVGGCAGSAAGGPKVLRRLLIARFTLSELRRTLHPRAVLPVRISGKVVPEHIIRGVMVFFLFYILTFSVCAAVVIGFGADIVTGVTATVAAIGNIGPGLSGVGPMSSYGNLHPISKLVLTAAMWIGRLEVVTVLALFRMEVWRDAHWVGSPVQR